MKKIVFATNNAHKLEEIRQILGDKLEVLSLAEIGCNEEIPETGTTFAANSLQKAQYIKDKYGYDCFADDSGLEVMALGGAPGVYSARYAGEPSNSERNMAKLLTELADTTHREAQFKTTIALIYEGDTHYFEGAIQGTILTEKRGSCGFGYDPLFLPSGYDCSFAEMGASQKNRISHRAQAVAKLAEFLL